MMKPLTIALSLLCPLTFALAGRANAADAPPVVTLDLWPGAAPGETGKIGEEQTKTKPDGKTVTSVTNVSKPTLTVYRPERDKDTGAAAVIFPGGGYTNLAWDHEGEQVARWLNSIGMTGAILKYRVPRRPETPRGEPPIQALMDAQRAIGLVRSKASEWGIDSKRIGVVGFSAGGHLGAWVSTNYDKRAYEPVDEADKTECRPDFAILVYPGGVTKRGTSELTPEIKITSQTPPTFFVHAADDGRAESSVALYLALRRADVPSELHVYGTGGHGFGMRPSNRPSSTWPLRAEEWFRDRGILKPAAK